MHHDPNPAPSSPPADGRPLGVLVVCSGNICRSPMAEQMLRRAFAEAGFDGQVTVTSAGTGAWNVGERPSEPTRRLLAAAGYPTDHVAQQVTREMVDGSALVLAAAREHAATLRRIAADPSTVHLLRSFDPNADGDEIPDPYRRSDAAYREVMSMIRAAVPGVVAAVAARLA